MRKIFKYVIVILYIPDHKGYYVLHLNPPLSSYHELLLQLNIYMYIYISSSSNQFVTFLDSNLTKRIYGMH